jgi:glycosyltransferase involved in cell wall biosynthesis
MLKAFYLVNREKKSRLIILGEGVEKEKLLIEVEKMGLVGEVIFGGFKENPYKYMTKSDIFILSSIREGFPGVLVEAMACGLPVISTDCKSGPNEIINNGENGFLTPVGNEKALSEAMLKLLDDRKIMEIFSGEGRKTAQNFSKEKSVKAYENVFDEITK